MTDRPALTAMAEQIMGPHAAMISLSLLNEDDAHPTLRQFDVVLITDPSRGEPEVGMVLDLTEKPPLVGAFSEPVTFNVDPAHLEVLAHTSLAQMARDAHGA